MMAIGLFQVRGGAEIDPVYEITSPIFDRDDDPSRSGLLSRREVRHRCAEQLGARTATSSRPRSTAGRSRGPGSITAIS